MSILCAVYSAVVYSVGSGTYSFTIWLGLCALFALFSFISVKKRYEKLPKAVKAVSLTLILSALVVFIFCQACVLSHFFDKGEPGLDYVIVLGAQMREDGPSVIYRYRLEAAYTYLVENENTVCIISGGKGSNESVTEGEGGRDYLIAKGIDEKRLIAENRAMDTTENIKYSFEIIEGLHRDGNAQNTGIDSNTVISTNTDIVTNTGIGANSGIGTNTGIITNNFHLFRGIHLAEKETGSDICGIAAYTEPLYLPNNMIRETFGILRDY
ncbi:MAG: YdcF family protein [Lachnospiraceae bacterium]|nr:YdcF family protein [Lachnospiraceae bacterium]